MTKYSKTPLNAIPLNAVSVLRGSIEIFLKRTLKWYLLYMCAPEIVHYIGFSTLFC